MRCRAAVAAFFIAALVAAPVRAQLADTQSRLEATKFFRTGLEFMSAEKFDRAAEEFTKAIGKDRLMTVAHYQLGQAYMGLQRYASAIQAYQGCIEAVRTLHGLEQSRRFEVDKQRDSEVREMRETIAVLQRSNHPLQAAQAEQHMHDLERQQATTDGVFRPPSEVLLSLGSAFFRNGDRDQAEAEWKAAIDVNPKLGEAHNNIAVIYMQTGRYDEAEREIKLAEKNGFRVNPQFKDDLKRRRSER